MFALGATKFVLLKQVSIKHGLEMAALGAGAAFVLYLFGQILASFG